MAELRDDVLRVLLSHPEPSVKNAVASALIARGFSPSTVKSWSDAWEHEMRGWRGQWVSSGATEAQTTHVTASGARVTHSLAPRVPSPREQSPIDLGFLPHEGSGFGEPGFSHLVAANTYAKAYTDEQMKDIVHRLSTLEIDMRKDMHKEKRGEFAVNLLAIIGAVGLAFVTGGMALAAIPVILLDKVPEIGRELTNYAKHAVDQRRFEREHGAAQKSASAMAGLLAERLSQGGLDPQAASRVASAVMDWVHTHAGPHEVPVIAPDDARQMLSALDTAEKSAETPVVSTVHKPLGTHGLWHDRSAQLPAYIQNIAHALIRGGMGESQAIATAIGSVKRWASGGGHVTPEVRTAAARAVAEWDELKATH